MAEELEEGAEVAEAKAADTAEGGWSVESHSAAPVESPSDTTLEPKGIDNDQPMTAEVEGDEAEGDEKPAVDAKPVAKAKVEFLATPKQPKVKPAKPRIDELTKLRRAAEARALAAETHAQELTARLTALEKAGKPAETAAVTKPAEKPAVDPALEIPDPPSYIDFDTDDAYKTAMNGWRKKVLDVQAAREDALATRLKTEITTGLETRLTTDQQAQQTAQAERALGQRMQAMKTAHPDFDDVLAENADVLAKTKHPFIQDLVVNTPEGAELLNDLVRDVDVTLALAALPLPTRPLADAVRDSPMSRQIMLFFGTEEGAEAFMRLRALPPTRVFAEIGKLENALAAAASAPAPGARHSITHAAPPAKAPVGAPRARESSAVPGAPPPFESWMDAEDRRERDEKLRKAGVAVPA